MIANCGLAACCLVPMPPAKGQAVPPETVPVDVPMDALKPGAGRIALARWDVVPLQLVGGDFEVGVVAHHLYGIDRVEFALPDGSRRTVHEPTRNPRTGAIEYWTLADAADYADGPMTIEATAYPRAGVPRELDPLTLVANAGGSIEELVVELPAGRHAIELPAELPRDGWYTLRPAPGVTREQCVLVGKAPRWRGNLRLAGVTYEPGAGNGRLYAHKEARLWLDHVDVRGNGPEVTTNWLGQGNEFAAYTDTEWRGTRRIIAEYDEVLVRNIVVHEVYEDFGNANGLYLNCDIRSLAAPATGQAARGAPGSVSVCGGQAGQLDRAGPGGTGDRGAGFVHRQHEGRGIRAVGH